VSGDNKIAGLAAVAAVGIGAIGYGASSLKHHAKVKKAAKKESEAAKAEEQKAAEHLDDDDVEIVDSYENTEELMKKFPLENPITIQDGIEKNIQNRLLTGF
jgi:hypothetical protein